MNIDVKHGLLKQFIGEQKAGQKGVGTTIDQSMVAGTEQKSLGMDLEAEGSETHDKTKKKKKLIADKLKKSIEDEQAKAKNETVERDPLKLLKILW